MARFAHIADSHLGGWKQKPMQEINFKSFQKAIEICIKSNLDFVLIAGDLFDSAYPPIEILKETFAEFRKLKDAKLPCFIIAGSHDYSVSGKTFLDVLEKGGFCTNVYNPEEREDAILLNPTIHEGVAFYGYPGRMSGLEIPKLRKVKLQDAPGLFKIFMLHTTLDKAKGTLPIDSIEADDLPQADYYAMGHLHMDFQYNNFVYPGPIFPNNFQELEDLHHGGFYIVDTEKENMLEKIELPIKKILNIEIKIKDATAGTERILAEIEKNNLEDKIILLRINGNIEKGKKSDIRFDHIEEYVMKRGAYFLLRNTHDLNSTEIEIEIETKNSENVEIETLDKFSKENPSRFNEIIPSLMEALSLEKQEDEKTEVFVSRLMDGTKSVLGLNFKDKN